MLKHMYVHNSFCCGLEHCVEKQKVKLPTQLAMTQSQECATVYLGNVCETTFIQ